MHGKSGSFASQNSRFRNVKSKLWFFFRIIFTKSSLLLLSEEWSLFELMSYDFVLPMSHSVP
ncbi:hypothetical protein CTI16_09335 [Prevotella intermedia]|uniref:Uncharacterized protein n=1 Tax=Prevotella intermedia TaxID=28131 RepID=A0AAJ3V8X6_PREIN|nr:hypothetical protein CTI16_09335 [Prevotella intermedia]